MAISSGEEAWYVVTVSPSSSSVVGVTLWQSARASTTSRTRDPISRRVRVAEVRGAVFAEDGVTSDGASPVGGVKHW